MEDSKLGMPSMPSAQPTGSAEETQTAPSVAPVTEASEANSETQESALSVPSHESETPKLHSTESTISNQLENVAIPKRGIEVVASRKGFYNQNRIRPGQKFFVSSMEELGTWMTCLDPALETKRLEMLKAKKARV